MTAIVPLSSKAIWLILEAIDARIVAEEERYTREDPADDDAGDYGNDLHYLKDIRAELAKIRSEEKWHARLYECWEDPNDGSISLLRYGDAELHKAKALLSANAKLLYTFPAATGEEASAVHYLRQGFGGYTPIGDVGECPTCGGAYYPLGSGDCWHCGNQD